MIVNEKIEISNRKKYQLFETTRSFEELKKLTNKIINYIVSSNDNYYQYLYKNNADNYMDFEQELYINEKIDPNDFNVLKKFIEFNDPPLLITWGNAIINRGEYDSANNTIKIAGKDFENNNKKNSLLHELQHAYDIYRSNHKMESHKNTKEAEKIMKRSNVLFDKFQDWLFANKLSSYYADMIKNLPDDDSNGIEYFKKLLNELKNHKGESNKKFRRMAKVAVNHNLRGNRAYYNMNAEIIAFFYGLLYEIEEDNPDFTLKYLISRIKKDEPWSFLSEDNKKKMLKFAYIYYNFKLEKEINLLLKFYIHEVKNHKLDFKNALNLLFKKINQKGNLNISQRNKVKFYFLKKIRGNVKIN